MLRSGLRETNRNSDGQVTRPETELSGNLVLKGSCVTLRIAASLVMLARCYIIDRAIPPSSNQCFQSVHCIKSLPCTVTYNASTKSLSSVRSR